MDDLFDTHDALATARLVKTGKLGVRELLDGTLRKLRVANRSLNAITDLYEDRLLESSLAAAGDGPFEGVPFLVKQLMADCAGTPTTMGSRFFASEPIARSDSGPVARMRRAGLVIVGRTNSSECGLAPTTEPAFGGVTRSPWGADLSPGGSSGGSAAIVAARCLPMAHATDGGGSIRIPASLCGLFGLKPSRGRISLAPIGEALAGAATMLCNSISVRDSAALLDVLAGNEPGDPYAAPARAGTFLEASGRPPGRLRIAFMRSLAGGEALEPALIAAVEDTARRLEALGHHLVEAAPEYDAEALQAAFWTVMCANTANNIQVRAQGRRAGDGDLEPVTRLCVEHGQAVSAPAYIRALQTFQGVGRSFGRFFESHDVLLQPTLACTSLKLGTVRMDGSLEAFERAVAPLMSTTLTCNATGVPAMSVPLASTPDGLPIGMHFVGRLGAEAMLLSLAAQLEQVHPWRQQRPPASL